MQVTLEKIAVLDPIFDSFDAVGAYEEVGDPVPGEAKILVRMHASLLWIVCISEYMQMRICIQYMDFEIYQSVCACNTDVGALPTVMYVMYCTN